MRTHQAMSRAEDVFLVIDVVQTIAREHDVDAVRRERNTLSAHEQIGQIRRW